MDKNLKILLLEDSTNDVDLIQIELKKGGVKFTPLVVDTKEDFIKEIRDFQPDLVLSDHSMPQFNSAEALKIFKDHLRSHQYFAPFILVTGTVSEEFAAQCIKDGADDYILKDNLQRLPSAIINALEKCRFEMETQKKTAQNLLLLERRLKREMNIKEKQIADASEEGKHAERLVIGKELHDNVNQLLGASKFCVDMAKRGGDHREMYLSRSSKYTLMAIEEIRKLSKQLITGTVKNPGLGESIEKIIRETMEVNPLKISCEHESFIELSVNDKFKQNLFRIVQEQLNNILKHANASIVCINLSQAKNLIILLITDNGVGFNTGMQRKGIGIKNIKSRASFYNGTAEFTSQPGQGCILTVKLPVVTKLLQKISGLELIHDNQSMLIEKVKNVIFSFINQSDKEVGITLSMQLGEKFKYNYSYLSNLFSKVEGITMEKFVILKKIERVKELLVNDGLNLTEIAWKLHYSSVSHLSGQFKKITGLTPSSFKKLYH